jgi:hypothetical protein
VRRTGRKHGSTRISSRMINWRGHERSHRRIWDTAIKGERRGRRHNRIWGRMRWIGASGAEWKDDRPWYRRMNLQDTRGNTETRRNGNINDQASGYCIRKLYWISY